jgi:SAM-dependent MidA family methyltransferase
MPTLPFDQLTKREQAIILVNELFDCFPDEEISIREAIDYDPVGEGEHKAREYRVEIVRKF